MKYILQKNSRNVILPFFGQQISSVVGGGLTGVYPGYSGLTAYYKRTIDSSITKFNLATGTVGTYVASGLAEISPTQAPGDYELSLPQNATVVPSGAPVFLTVSLIGGTDMLPVKMDIELVDGGAGSAIVEPSAVPSFPCSADQMIAFLFQRAAFQEYNTSSSATICKSDGTPLATAPLSDDSTTLTRGKFS